MGCVISAVPPAHSKNKAGWCSCFICVDQSYTFRHNILFNKLSGITDLVKLVESYIPLDCPHLPLWYVNENRKEFYQIKPHPMFGHVVWNYYASQHKGAALYASIRGTYQEAVWIDETHLKLQILDKHFQAGRHPNCLKGFRSIIQNGSLSASRFNTIVHHFHFWLKAFTLKIFHFSNMRLELEGFYPLIWIIFIFLLRSKTAPFVTKNQIIKFLILHPFFCTSIQENWTKLAGEFLAALSAPPSLRRTMFVDILSGGEEERVLV